MQRRSKSYVHLVHDMAVCVCVFLLNRCLGYFREILMIAKNAAILLRIQKIPIIILLLTTKTTSVLSNN